jgi:hypothetical protein
VLYIWRSQQSSPPKFLLSGQKLHEEGDCAPERRGLRTAAIAFQVQIFFAWQIGPGPFIRLAAANLSDHLLLRNVASRSSNASVACAMV